MAKTKRTFPRASKRTAERDQTFFEALETGLSVAKAAAMAGYATRTVYDYHQKHPEFAAAMDEARETGTARLEDEVLRRAVEGVEKPIYHRGQKIDVVREYSDTLLIFMLKARKPEKYRERATVEHTGSITYEQAVKQFNGEG